MLKLKALSARRKWTLAALLVTVLLIAGTAVGLSLYYEGRALPGASVAGQNMSGKTRSEVAKIIDSRAEDTSLKVSVADKKKSFNLADVGAKIDTNATVDKLFATNKSPIQRVLKLGKAIAVTPVYEVDSKVFDTAADGLSKLVGVTGKDAVVAFNAESEKFEVTPAEPGKVVNTEQLRQGVKEAAEKLADVSTVLEVQDQIPAVTTEDAQAALTEINTYTELKVDVSDGEQTYQPNPTDRSKWLAIDASKGAKGVTVKADAVSAWVKELGESTNVEARDGIRNVNLRGDVVGTHEEGVKGYKVNNIDKVAKELVDAFQGKQPYAGKFEYDVTEPHYENRLVAEGSENLIYQAAPGEKWIDVNLTSATITAFEGATAVHGPIGIVPGAPGMETITGKFNVYLKVPTQTLRGTNPDGTKYEAPNVPWILYFHGDYALHGAPWRDRFGWSGPGGSHGCVNLPVSDAQWIYNWASIGTPVISHY